MNTSVAQDDFLQFFGLVQAQVILLLETQHVKHDDDWLGVGKSGYCSEAAADEVRASHHDGREMRHGVYGYTITGEPLPTRHVERGRDASPLWSTAERGQQGSQLLENSEKESVILAFDAQVTFQPNQEFSLSVCCVDAKQRIFCTTKPGYAARSHIILSFLPAKTETRQHLH